MTKIRHKRNGIPINPPRNWDGLEVAKDFTKRIEDATINISKLTFVGKDAIDIRERIKDGLNGGLGIFESDKYDIEVGEPGNPAYTFEGYLDYTEAEFIAKNEVEVPLMKRQGTDWLNDVADSISFRYLESIGEITQSDFKKVPYVINYIPDGMQLGMLAVSLFIMTKTLIESIRNTADAIADVTDANTPVIGVAVPGGPVTAYDIGNYLLIAIKIVAQIAYTIAIALAIKNLMVELLSQILQLKRHHLGMSVQDLFTKGCEHFDLKLESDLLSSKKNWVTIPAKGHKGGQKPTGFKGNWSETGVPNASGPIDTFGDLIRVFQEGLNADFRIKGGVFKFERRDFFNSSSGYVIPNTFIDQDLLQDRYSTNASEMVGNHNITWAYDTQDQNTLDNQEGRVFQAILSPNTIQNKDLVNIKGLDTASMPFSMGLEKTELTAVENVLKGLGKFVDKLTGIFGSGTNFASQINNRKGALLLSSHFTSLPKMVVMSGTKLANNQRDLLAAERLWDELFFINSFKKINGVHNQFLKYRGIKVPFSWENFLVLLENNKCETWDSREAFIELLRWKTWQNYAIIDIKVNEEYTKNLKIEYVT